ncbi:hypothetical protein ACRAVF_27100 [Bradyrhizobium oligotrophicum S58]
MIAKLGTMQGQLPTDLANAISDVIHAFLERGMETDEVCSVVVAVAADYGRGEYGEGYLAGLADVVKVAASKPMPENIAKGPKA